MSSSPPAGKSTRLVRTLAAIVLFAVVGLAVARLRSHYSLIWVIAIVVCVISLVVLVGIILGSRSRNKPPG